MLLHQLLESTNPLTKAWEAHWPALVDALRKMGEKEDMLASMLEKAVAKHAKSDPTKLFSFLPPLIAAREHEEARAHHLYPAALNALLNGVTKASLEAGPEEVKALVKKVPLDKLARFITPKLHAELKLSLGRHARTKEEEQFDEENDLFVFVARPAFVERPEGSGNFKKTLDIENMVKVDRFDAKAHQLVGMLKFRANAQGEGSEVYMVHLPAGAMKGGRPEPWLVDLIDKHKRKVTH
jgi:hypothetical protein